jgi:thiamine phosphate synthase YjbQ (UPF0047 family)
MPAPVEVSLAVTPSARLDVIDIRDHLPANEREALEVFPRALYCSYHTTAGYLDQGFASRLNAARVDIPAYIQVFQTIFPEAAGYRHDELHLRADLSDDQRHLEPRNADAHLAFIGAGLRNCVRYVNRPHEPVYFIDLDGMRSGRPRQRLTSVIGYTDEEVVARTRLTVPISAHPVDSVNLKAADVGVYAQIQQLIALHGVATGRVHLVLAADEEHAGLTMNEYETLLMRHDLAEVLRDPLRFMAEKGRNAVADPWTIPHKTIGYAQYDLVRVFNRLFDTFGMNESLIEKAIARILAMPARRFLRMKRSVSLLVSDRECAGRGALVGGAYQSPILVQWDKASGERRRIDLTLTRLT